jgi:cytochrome P450
MEESNRRVLAPWRTWLPTPEWFRYHRNVAALNKYIMGVLKTRWAKRQRGEGAKEGEGDIVDRAMAAIPEADWGAAACTQLCYEIKTFLLAGHETSAAMLTFALFELTQHPQVLAKGEATAAPRMDSTLHALTMPPPTICLSPGTRLLLGASPLYSVQGNKPWPLLRRICCVC